MDASKRLEKLEKEFLRDWVRRNPLLGASLGFHDDHDDAMPDGSLDKELDDQKFLRRMLGEFEKIDARRLSPLRAVDRDLAVHALRNWLFDREVVRLWESSPEAPHVMGQAIFQVLSRNYAPLSQRMRSIMKRIERMPKYVDQSRSRLKTPSKMFVEIELETITRLPGFFNILKDIGREHLPPTPQRELNRLIDQAQNALERYSDWLIVDVLPDCRDDYAIGDDRFRRLLQVRGIDASPAQLAAAAESELTRLRERQREVGRAVKRKVPIEDVRDMIKQQHPENFDGVLRFVRESVGKSRQFLTRSKFALLPEGEQLYVIDTPTFLRHRLPTGGYGAPAKFEPKQEGYYYVTPGDCDSDKLKEHNYATLANMTVQQGYPGRHLQMAWAVRHPNVLRSLAEDPAVTFGWAHYCEERVKEVGYDDTPASRFMQLQSSVLSCARVLIDVRLSTGRMTGTQAVEALIDYMGMDRVCAEAEVRRYVSTPGSQLAPFWGRDRYRELRRWAKDEMEGRFSETFFHTAVLQSGLLPFPLLKRELAHRIAEELRKPPERPPEGKRPSGAPAGASKPAPRRAPAPARPARPR